MFAVDCAVAALLKAVPAFASTVDKSLCNLEILVPCVLTTPSTRETSTFVVLIAVVFALILCLMSSGAAVQSVDLVPISICHLSRINPPPKLPARQCMWELPNTVETFEQVLV